MKTQPKTEPTETPKRRRANDPTRKRPDPELVLPMAEQTEREVLGIFLLEPEALAKGVEHGLRASLFAVKSHQLVFTALTDIKAKGWEITFKTLVDYLTGQHVIEKIGGPAFVASLIDGSVAKASRLSGLVKQLEDMHFKRETVRKASELLKIAGNGASPAEIEEYLDTFQRTHTATQSYVSTPTGLWHRKPARFGFGFENERVANFAAKIVEEQIEDDGGAEEQRIFLIEVSIKNEAKRIEVPASKFNSMNWTTEMLGAEAWVFPGKGEHAKCAIQTLSPGLTKRTVYAHTGWRLIENDWCYLHSAGAITGNGNRSDISVRLPKQLQHFTLPEPATKKEIPAAYNGLLEFLNIFPHHLSAPVIGSVLASVLGDPDYSLYVVGQSGSFKSELTALAQNFFGKDFKRLQLPTNWHSTSNSLLDLGFVVKDALLVIDDFAPNGQKRHDDELHAKAETVFRAAGNRAGKGKLGVDHKQRTAKEPRCLYQSSGEDLPKGMSLQARLHIVAINKGEIRREDLSVMQKKAQEGSLAKSLATFLSYMARDYPKVKKTFEADCEKFRDQLAETMKGHARQPTTLAHLLSAWRAWLHAAFKEKAITKDAAKDLWDAIWKALVTSGESQKDHHVSMHPADHFFELLRSALLSGDVHLEMIEGNEPPEIGRLCGWRNGVPNGRCVGWVDEDITYLEPRSAFNVANGEGLRGGEGLAVGQTTLWKRMDERGLIVRKDTGRYLKCRTPRTAIPAIAVNTNVLFARGEGAYLAKPDEPDEPDG